VVAAAKEAGMTTEAYIDKRKAEDQAKAEAKAERDAAKAAKEKRELETFLREMSEK
jgi:hypothetical protein